MNCLKRGPLRCSGMDMVEPTLEMLQALMVRCLDGQADIKRELADVCGLTLLLSDKVERLDRSISEVKRDMYDIKDDIWIMLKSELMGRQGNFETRVEARPRRTG